MTAARDSQVLEITAPMEDSLWDNWSRCFCRATPVMIRSRLQVVPLCHQYECMGFTWKLPYFNLWFYSVFNSLLSFQNYCMFDIMRKLCLKIKILFRIYSLFSPSKKEVLQKCKFKLKNILIYLI